MKPLLVAEISANHLRSPDRAQRILEEAIWAGADLAKGQCWDPNLMVGGPRTILGGPWSGRDMRALYEEAHMPKGWHMMLLDRARELGADYFATAFDIPSLEFLDSIGVRRHKIASFELVDLELVGAAASIGKPLILSTGMATFQEIEDAVRMGQSKGLKSSNLTLLRCVSAYPSHPEDAGLGSMAFLANYFGCRVGLSDHSRGTAVAVAATALGASMVEKHLTLKREDGGPDAGFSLEPQEFATLVHDCKTARVASGEATFQPKQSEEPQLALRRSLWWAEDLPSGHVVRRIDIKSSRPADGMRCSQLPSVVGAKIARQVRAGTPIIPADLVP